MTIKMFSNIEYNSITKKYFWSVGYEDSDNWYHTFKCGVANSWKEASENICISGKELNLQKDEIEKNLENMRIKK